MVIQVFVGAMNIWFKLSSWVSVTHLGVATLIWGALIAATVLGGMAATEQSTADAGVAARAVTSRHGARRTRPT
jgi:heme A synthase